MAGSWYCKVWLCRAPGLGGPVGWQLAHWERLRNSCLVPSVVYQMVRPYDRRHSNLYTRSIRACFSQWEQCNRKTISVFRCPVVFYHIHSHYPTRYIISSPSLSELTACSNFSILPLPADLWVITTPVSHQIHLWVGLGRKIQTLV